MKHNKTDMFPLINKTKPGKKAKGNSGVKKAVKKAARKRG